MGESTPNTPASTDGALASPEAHEPPPAPINRSITPAPQDFENPPPVRHMLWPVFWCGMGALLIVALSQTLNTCGWPVPTDTHSTSN